MRKRVGAAAVVVMLTLALAGHLCAGEPSGKHGELDKLKWKDQMVDLHFEKVRVDRLFESFYKLGAVERVRVADEVAAKFVAVEVNKLSVKETLILIADKNGLAYEVPDPETLIVKAAEPKP